MSQITAFPTKLHVRPAKAQISQRIRAVRTKSSQVIPWVAKNQKRLQEDSEDTDLSLCWAYMQALEMLLSSSNYSLPGIDIYAVSAVVYPTIPIVSPPTDFVMDLENSPCRRGSLVMSVFADTTGTVRLLRKETRPSTPISNS